MDTKILIKKLNDVFCENNKVGKKYSEIWLSEVDFGGLYNNGMFWLCVKVDHKIDSCLDEIKEILSLLNEDANEELKYIWSVRVYNANDEIHCESNDLRILDEASFC